MFDSIEEAENFALQYDVCRSLDKKDLKIVVKDLYLNAEDYKDANGIILKWTE